MCLIFSDQHLGNTPFTFFLGRLGHMLLKNVRQITIINMNEMLDTVKKESYLQAKIKWIQTACTFHKFESDFLYNLKTS